MFLIPLDFSTIDLLRWATAKVTRTTEIHTALATARVGNKECEGGRVAVSFDSGEIGRSSSES